MADATLIRQALRRHNSHACVEKTTKRSSTEWWPAGRTSLLDFFACAKWATLLNPAQRQVRALRSIGSGRGSIPSNPVEDLHRTSARRLPPGILSENVHRRRVRLPRFFKPILRPQSPSSPRGRIRQNADPYSSAPRPRTTKRGYDWLRGNEAQFAPSSPESRADGADSGLRCKGQGRCQQRLQSGATQLSAQSRLSTQRNFAILPSSES